MPTVINANHISALERAITVLVARIAELDAEGSALATGFIDRRKEYLKAQPGNRPGYAPLYLSHRFHKGSIELRWKVRHSPRRKDRRSTVSRFEISKGKNDLYALSKLVAQARPWEVEDVIATEIEAARIRAEARNVQRVLRMTRYALANLQMMDRRILDDVDRFRGEQKRLGQEVHLLAWKTPSRADANAAMPAEDAPADVDLDLS